MELLISKYRIFIWSGVSKYLANGRCVKSVRIRSCSGPYFSAFGLNTVRYSVSLRIQSECVKIRTRIIPTTDTFYAVRALATLGTIDKGQVRKKVNQGNMRHYLFDSNFELNVHSKVWQFLTRESPLKMMKNGFYFTLKALFLLKIFKFLSWLFGHIENSTWLDR